MKNADLFIFLGERIRTIRKARHITQERLAEIADLNLSYMSEIERGQANVSLCIVNTIANALGISLLELLGGVPTGIESASFNELLLHVQSLDEKQKKLFVAAARGLLSGIRDN